MIEYFYIGFSLFLTALALLAASLNATKLFFEIKNHLNIQNSNKKEIKSRYIVIPTAEEISKYGRTGSVKTAYVKYRSRAQQREMKIRIHSIQLLFFLIFSFLMARIVYLKIFGN